MDDQSAFCLLQSVSNKQAHKQSSASTMSHITLLAAALSPLKNGLNEAWKDSFSPNLACAFQLFH